MMISLTYSFIHNQSIIYHQTVSSFFYISSLSFKQTYTILHNNLQRVPACNSRALYMPCPLHNPLSECQESHRLAEVHRIQLHMRKPDHFSIITQQLHSIPPSISTERSCCKGVTVLFPSCNGAFAITSSSAGVSLHRKFCTEFGAWDELGSLPTIEFHSIRK